MGSFVRAMLLRLWALEHMLLRHKPSLCQCNGKEGKGGGEGICFHFWSTLAALALEAMNHEFGAYYKQIIFQV